MMHSSHGVLNFVPVADLVPASVCVVVHISARARPARQIGRLSLADFLKLAPHSPCAAIGANMPTSPQ
jgi:hypothetical protein